VAPSSGHVRAGPTGAGCSRSGKEWVRPSSWGRRSPREPIEQLNGRLDKTVAFLKTLDAKQIDASADREITFPLGPDNKGHMKGSDYLNHFVLPNFYFHLTTAYAILRNFGVELGKGDFMGAIPMRMT
jgi:hypothetical protein